MAGQCHKLSLKLKFNYEDKDQRFFGLKKVMLHASLSDTTMMRERLAYSLWREMGVPAPRSVHIGAQLRISDPAPVRIPSRSSGRFCLMRLCCSANEAALLAELGAEFWRCLDDGLHRHPPRM